MSEVNNLQSISSHSFPQLIWNKLPLSRRSAVFILLFLGQLNELRVILTKRSSSLRNFPGHISLPGGKADLSLESEWNVARREMEEEIGLSSDDDFLLKQYGFTVDHVNILPSYLSRTFSAVRPCVGFMKFKNPLHSNAITSLSLSLNPGESSSIFSCPLKDFLYPLSTEFKEVIECSSNEVLWGGVPWHLRSYTFKQNNPYEVQWLKIIDDLSVSEGDDSSFEDEIEKLKQSGNADAEFDGEVDRSEESDRSDRSTISSANVESNKTSVNESTADETGKSTAIQSKADDSGSKSSSKAEKKKTLEEWGRLGSRVHEDTNEKIYDVWGLTANILHDLAELTYTGKFDREMGEEQLIYSIWEYGNQMRQKARSPEEVKLINSTGSNNEFGFNDILPRHVFLNLKKIYKL